LDLKETSNSSEENDNRGSLLLAINLTERPMSHPRYTFEEWTLDCSSGALRSGNRDIPLRPKSFEVLRFMIENAGHVVSRDDLLSAVWSGVTVTEESLTQCVSEVRRALGASGQRIIKTVPKRGYMFAVTVTGSYGSKQVSDDPSKVGPEDSAAVRPLLDGISIAVLPFANLSGDINQEYLSDGITEDILSGLSYFADLSVIARSSSFSYKGRATDVREIGQQLGVRYVVEGSVRRMGERIRITAQLNDTQTGVGRWSERFDRELGDIFIVQDEITRAIVSTVVAHLGKAESERILRKSPSSWSAYDLLMRGDQAQRAYEQSWAPNHFYEARQYFSQAQRADPGNARICAMLGHTYVSAHTDPAGPELGNLEVLKQGYELVSQAVNLDPNEPLARAMLGWTLLWMGELDASLREYEVAFVLNPSFWDWKFASVLVYAGAASRALEAVHAHVRLDPFHPPYVYAHQGHALYALRRYAEAVTPLRECIRRGPQMLVGHVWLAATLARLGQRTEARALIAEVLKRAPQMKVRWRAPSLYRSLDDAAHMTDALRDAGFA
jgi:adenylate cyclase